MSTSQAFIPEIEEAVPLPASAADALPDLTPAEELDMRVRTIKLISDLTGVPIKATPEDEDKAKDLAKKMMTDPKMRPEYAKYPNEMMAYLAGLVAQTNCMLVDELSDLKLYVVNKLVYEIEHATDSKSRIAALSKLGEIDGVDAFKRRTEVTMQIKPLAEVEKELKTILEGIEYSVVEPTKAEITENSA
jgi:hypothetical protein